MQDVKMQDMKLQDMKTLEAIVHKEILATCVPRRRL